MTITFPNHITNNHRRLCQVAHTLFYDHLSRRLKFHFSNYFGQKVRFVPHRTKDTIVVLYRTKCLIFKCCVLNRTTWPLIVPGRTTLIYECSKDFILFYIEQIKVILFYFQEWYINFVLKVTKSST